MYLLKTWVKAPQLKNSDWLIIGECVKYINSNVLKKLSEGRVVLSVCPEADGSLIYGKLASMIRSSNPKSITVLTIDSSPHCLALHAAVNEALYIVKEKVPRKHYVLIDGTQLVEISPNAIRVARYLHLVEKLVKENPEILKELEKHSLEYKVAREVGEEDQSRH